MRSLRPLLLLVMLSLTAPALSAVDARPTTADPALEAKMMGVAAILRCLVCQNQTIAESNAPLAVDLKQQIREKLAAGMSEDQIADFMVQRYGEFVLYTPPVKSTTWLLWFGPFVLLAWGVTALFMKLRQRNRARPEPDLSQAEHERAMALLESGDRRECS